MFFDQDHVCPEIRRGRGWHFICRKFPQTALFSASAKLAGTAPSQNWGPSRESLRPAADYKLAPTEPLDVLNFVKMRVPANNWQSMLSSQCGNPSVVGRNRGAARL